MVEYRPRKPDNEWPWWRRSAATSHRMSANAASKISTTLTPLLLGSGEDFAEVFRTRIVVASNPSALAAWMRSDPNLGKKDPANWPGLSCGEDFPWGPLSNAGAGFWVQPRPAVALRAVSVIARLAATFYNVAVTP